MERREWEKKKKRKRKRRRSSSKAKKVWNFGFLYGNYIEYGFCMDHMDFVWDSRKVYEFQI